MVARDSRAVCGLCAGIRHNAVVANVVRTWGPAIVWMALIFVLSSQSSDGRHSDLVLVLRKGAHVCEYLILTVLLRRCVRPSLAALIALGYAASDEWHQTFVPGREGVPRDVAIDGIGIALATVLMPRIRRSRIT